MEWHVRAEGQQLGPISEQDLLAWARAGRLKHGMGRAVFGIVMGALGTVALVLFVAGSLK